MTRSTGVTRPVGRGAFAMNMRVGSINRSGKFRSKTALPAVATLRHAHWLHPGTMSRYIALEPVEPTRRGPQRILALRVTASAKGLARRCDGCVYYHDSKNDLCMGNHPTVQLKRTARQSNTLLQFRNPGAVAGRLLSEEVQRSGRNVSLVQILLQLV